MLIVKEKHLLTLAIITSVVGIIMLSILEVNSTSTLEAIRVYEVRKANEGYIGVFEFNKTFKLYSNERITPGKYLVLLQRGGNDFYYLESFQKINGSD